MKKVQHDSYSKGKAEGILLCLKNNSLKVINEFDLRTEYFENLIELGYSEYAALYWTAFFFDGEQ